MQHQRMALFHFGGRQAVFLAHADLAGQARAHAGGAEPAAARKRRLQTAGERGFQEGLARGDREFDGVAVQIQVHARGCGGLLARDRGRAAAGLGGEKLSMWIADAGTPQAASPA